jgi:hypothetical protein
MGGKLISNLKLAISNRQMVDSYHRSVDGAYGIILLMKENSLKRVNQRGTRSSFATGIDWIPIQDWDDLNQDLSTSVEMTEGAGMMAREAV